MVRMFPSVGRPGILNRANLGVCSEVPFDFTFIFSKFLVLN